MAKTATERETDLKRKIKIYLDTVMIARGWSQSELARQIGTSSTTINKAVKLRHTLGYPKLMLLADRSGFPIPDEVEAAVKAPLPPVARDIDKEVEDFLNSSPAWRRMVNLGRALATETDAHKKRELRQQIEALIAQVA